MSFKLPQPVAVLAQLNYQAYILNARLDRKHSKLASIRKREKAEFLLKGLGNNHDLEPQRIDEQELLPSERKGANSKEEFSKEELNIIEEELVKKEKNLAREAELAIRTQDAFQKVLDYLAVNAGLDISADKSRDTIISILSGEPYTDVDIENIKLLHQFGEKGATKAIFDVLQEEYADVMKAHRVEIPVMGTIVGAEGCETQNITCQEPSLLELQNQKPLEGQAENKSDQNLIGQGAAPRNIWFLEQYEAAGTDTYHKPAKIFDKWDRMTSEGRACICPDCPGKIAKSSVASAIKRARKQRDGKPKEPSSRRKS